MVLMHRGFTFPLVRANRNIDAARLYRDALRTAPAWAEGHFNLGLLYGELELYPEAITEMRRYLYLAPNAPDARAVQDRIYEWEAALAR
jgi:tetratricopeptide (TPR) repeat protein